MKIDNRIFSVHPDETETEKEMQSYLFLEKLGVSYRRVNHDEAATIDLCEQVENVIDAKICKNLLLCNRQQTEFYMLLLRGDLVFKTKHLSQQIGSARLSFANGEQMEELLNVSPGSLTVLSLQFDPDRKVNLLIEKHLLEDGDFACHPCVNTATVCFSTDDLIKKVIPALGHPVTYVDLEQFTDEV